MIFKKGVSVNTVYFECLLVIFLMSMQWCWTFRPKRPNKQRAGTSGSNSVSTGSTESPSDIPHSNSFLHLFLHSIFVLKWAGVNLTFYGFVCKCGCLLVGWTGRALLGGIKETDPFQQMDPAVTVMENCFFGSISASRVVISFMNHMT